MKNYFGDTTWTHFESYDSSAYLMLNKKHSPSSTVIHDIIKMFKNIYDEFDGMIVQIS